VCDQLELRARAAGVTVRTPAPTAGLGVAADPVRLRQVLLNLVSNAIAYNREGGDVLVEIRQTAAGATLAVHDTGVGIAEARMADLFQPFNRLGRETSATPGVGIGLALSRRLVEAMGGRLEAASEAGEGSTFTLHLPLARAAVAPVQASAIPMGSLPAATVLYVEDHPSNIALMRHVMAALGPVQLHVAETGPDGLALARDLKPDVILTDINLPGLCGFELKGRLDADPLTRGIPVLALTASALPGDVRRGKAAGFRDYLTKPLDIAALAAALNRALGATAAEASSRAA
jgi:CheY-like chemotaxis protein